MALTGGTNRTAFEFIESLEPRILLAVGPTNFDQYMLELLNRARGNPAAEAARFGISLNEGVPTADLISTAVVRQPLAFNPALITSAQGHSTWMLAHGLFQHAGANNNTPGDRMTAAGYAFNAPAAWGENIAWESATAPALPLSAATVADLHAALFVDSGYEGRGHRMNMLDAAYREVGVGAVAGKFRGFDALMITQDFAAQAGNPFITGVVYDDSLVTADSFYTPGEGLGKVTVRAVSATGTYTTTTWDTGGYSLQVPAGVYSVTFSGGTLTHAYAFAGVVVADQNVKQDFLTNLIPTSLDLVAAASAASGRTVYARPGANVTLAATVRNSGTTAIPDTFSVAVYQSPDKTMTTADTVATSYTLAGLKAGQSDSRSLTFAAPAAAGTYYLSIMADNTNVVAESAEENNWGATITLMVGEPNLKGAFSTISLPATIVPGDKGLVRFTVTNTGQIPATGAVDVKIYASADNTGPDAGDKLLLTFGGTASTWLPGQSRTFAGTAAITDELANGTYWLVAAIDTQNAVAESNETDNTVVAADSRQLKRQFGTFDGRTGARLSVHDSGGAVATFSLAGPGWGEVLGGAAFTDTILHDTTAASAFTVTTPAYRTALGNITVLGHVRSIVAKAKLTGNIDVGGGIAALSLLDVDPAAAGQSTIALHTNGALAVAPALKATLTLGAVHDCSVTATGLPIQTLTAVGWLDSGADNDVIRAPSIARLTVSKRAATASGLGASAGNFQADLDVTGALGAATIAGSVNGANGAWNLGSLGTVNIAGDLADCRVTLTQAADAALPARLTLTGLTVAGWIRDSRINSAGHVGTVTAGGLWNADIFAGVNPLPLASLPDPATDLIPGVRLAGVTVRGTVKTVDGYSTLNANLAAYSITSVSLVSPLAANTPSQAWGLAYHTLKAYGTRTGTVRYSWTPRSADLVPASPGGDFTVRQA